MNRPSSLDRETFQQLLANAFAVQESQINPQSLSAILEVQRSLASGKLELNGAMTHIVEAARNVASASGVAIALLKGDRLIYQAASGASAIDAGRRVAASFTLSAGIRPDREILRVENAETDKRIEADICRQFGANALLILPIYHARVLAGIFDVRFNEAHFFQPPEVRTYRLMAEQIEAALFSGPHPEPRKNPAAEPAPLTCSPDEIAVPDENFVPPPEFFMLPENEHSLYARCGAVLADIGDLPGFKHSVSLATTLTQRVRRIHWPKRPQSLDPAAIRNLRPVQRARSLVTGFALRAGRLRWPQRPRNFSVAPIRDSPLFRRSASLASSVTQRVRFITWPRRPRSLSVASIRNSQAFQRSGSLLSGFARRAQRFRLPERPQNLSLAALKNSPAFQRPASLVAALAQRAKYLRWPKNSWNLAVVALVIVLAFSALIARKGRGPESSVDSSTLPVANAADQHALAKPVPGKSAAEVQSASVPSKQARPAKSALKRVRVGPNEVDYIGEDVTVRVFADKPAAKRVRASNGRIAHIGDDVTVRYFSPPPPTTRTDSR